MVPGAAQKETVDSKVPDAQLKSSSLPVTQTGAAQVPVNTPNLVSKLVVALQVVAVTKLPLPTKEYHTPGAVVKRVPQLPAAASAVAVIVCPVTVAPQVMEVALAQLSLTGGAQV